MFKKRKQKLIFQTGKSFAKLFFFFITCHQQENCFASDKIIFSFSLLKQKERKRE